ncbi:MAG TPA: DNA primase noncatalytic subunit PriX [Nitrososphaerales archaeon]|nr:DNA primase noncatalytic subunit PriX [Nitrososphaerales archaeon]
MSQKGPVLTDLMVRYPFIHYSRRFFDSIPIEESFSSREVLRQAEMRLMSALGRANYEPHITELVEFSSFFVSAFVASQESLLAGRFAKREAERSRGLYEREDARDKATVIRECFGIGMLYGGSGDSRYSYSAGVEEYLTLVSRYELAKAQRWKLVRQALSGGRVYFTDNVLNDLFGDSAQKAILDGLKNLRKAPFPRQLAELRSRVLTYVPASRIRTGRSYTYIDELLKHPIADGRHRFVWLVLAPFLVNVRKLEEEDAIEKIKAYVSSSGDMRAMKRFVEYNVKRAKRNGLMPPTLPKLRSEHPDLFSLLPKEVSAMEEPLKAANSRTSTK